MNHVFVDFENVPYVDLALIGDQTVAVTLLIGEKQRRLELGLVRQIHEHAAKVALIEVGASGRNALDLVLAWHLGKTAERHPEDPFFVVSKDKDFDPLIVHLRARGLKVTRVDAFSALPFLPHRPTAPHVPAPSRTRSRQPGVRSPTPAHPLVVTTPAPQHADERLAKLIDRLQNKTKARPTRRRTLLSHINGFYSNHLSETELDVVAARLQELGIIVVDTVGRVSYPPIIAAAPASGAAPRRRRRPAGGAAAE